MRAAVRPQQRGDARRVHERQLRAIDNDQSRVIQSRVQFLDRGGVERAGQPHMPGGPNRHAKREPHRSRPRAATTVASNCSHRPWAPQRTQCTLSNLRGSQFGCGPLRLTQSCSSARGTAERGRPFLERAAAPVTREGGQPGPRARLLRASVPQASRIPLRAFATPGPTIDAENHSGCASRTVRL